MPDTHDDSHQMTTVLRDGVWYDFCYSCQRDIGPMVSQARAMIEARLPLTSDEQEVLLAHIDTLTAALEAEWYNGNLDEKAYRRLCNVAGVEAYPSATREHR
jgi:hypothetical protein